MRHAEQGRRRRAEEDMEHVVFHSCSRVMSVSAAAVTAAGALVTATKTHSSQNLSEFKRN